MVAVKKSKKIEVLLMVTTTMTTMMTTTTMMMVSMTEMYGRGTRHLHARLVMITKMMRTTIKINHRRMMKCFRITRLSNLLSSMLMLPLPGFREVSLGTTSNLKKDKHPTHW